MDFETGATLPGACLQRAHECSQGETTGVTPTFLFAIWSNATLPAGAH
jgi:hypothetical protein